MLTSHIWNVTLPLGTASQAGDICTSSKLIAYYMEESKHSNVLGLLYRVSRAGSALFISKESKYWRSRLLTLVLFHQEQTFAWIFKIKTLSRSLRKWWCWLWVSEVLILVLQRNPTNGAKVGGGSGEKVGNRGGGAESLRTPRIFK